MKIASGSQNLYSLNNKKQQSAPAFTGLTNNKLYGKIESAVANGCVRLVSTDAAKTLITKTSENKNLSDKLTSHLIVLGSTLLSGFYVGKTLNNKKMDEHKRKTLAVNQALTYGASTVMAYTFDGWARKYFTKNVINKFVTANKKSQKEVIQKLIKEKSNLGKAELLNIVKTEQKAFLKNLNTYKAGFGIARTIIIVDTVYRFIAPVIVTPLANHIGNKLKDKKTASN